MNNCIVFAGVVDPDMKDIAGIFDGEFNIEVTSGIEDTWQRLTHNYKTLRALFICIDLFIENQFQLINQIKSNNKLNSIPVICIGDKYADDTSRALDNRKVLRNGALIFFTKPFDLEAIHLQIRNMIELYDNNLDNSAFSSDYGNINEGDLLCQMQVIIQHMNCGTTVSYEEFGAVKHNFVNELFYSMFGYTEEEYLKDEVDFTRDIVLPVFYSEVRSAINTAKTQMKPVTVVFQARKRDSSIIWVKFNYSVQYVKTERKLMNISFFEDITAMKMAEDRIHILVDKLAHSEVYFQVNLTSRVVEEHHSQYEEDIERYTRADYRELLLEHIYERERDSIWNIFCYENLINNYNAGNTRLSVEYRRKMNNGEICWYAATAVLMKGAAGDSITAFIYAHNIDNKMKSRIAKNRIVQDGVTDIIIVNIASGLCRNIKYFDSDEDNLDICDNYEDKLKDYITSGVEREDEEKCREFFSYKNLIPEIEKNGSASISFGYKDKKGNTIRKNFIVIYLDETHEDALMIGRDITDLFEKEQEQQMVLQHMVRATERANNAKSDFLSRMSHDMRTPLNAIIGMIELARKENKKPEISSYLESIDVSSRFLKDLINDSLDLSKIESGKMELHEEPYPIDEFILGINTVIKPLMDAKNIEFVMKLDRSVTNIIVDKVRFNQIFYNVLSNSVKYTPSGGRVEFFTELIEKKSDKYGLRFHVKDNGIGMSEDFLGTLFDPFVREDNSTVNEQNGTGLGLTIVKKIVDLLEGNIEVISSLDKGTEFIIDIYAYNHINKIDEICKSDCDLQKLKGLHALIVDDTDTNTYIISKMLEYQGVIVDVASNGLEGYNKFKLSKENYYDVILTDIRMPVMDGFEETQMIRDIDRADAKIIPIIGITADAYDDVLTKLLESGMNERIVKPISTDVLYETIIKVIG